jgi:hypothetical protein
VILEARAEGTWGNKLKVRATEVRTAGNTVKYVNLDLLLGDDVVESFKGLLMDEESPNYLFDRINQQSRLVVAYDALSTPTAFANPTKFDATAATASAEFLADDGITKALKVEAQNAGRAGNRIVISVRGVDPGKRTIEVRPDGVDPIVYKDVDIAAIKAIQDDWVKITFADPLTPQLPKQIAIDGRRLTGGRDAGPALFVLSSAKPIAELLPASEALNDAEIDLKTTGALMNIDVRVGGETLESFTGLSMDPDDPRYLVDVLRQSKTLRARDLAERIGANTLPKQIAVKLTGGTSPSVDDYTAALANLELAEEVDLVIASTALQFPDDNAKALKVQQAVVAHCTKMGDRADNRIGLGSIFETENTDIAKILDHADDVRSDHFILTAPAGTEASLAGLLGRLDYFRSPTFKPIATVDAPLVPYTDTQLSKLITANVAVITKRTGVGIITVKGLLTSSRQINVQRTADVAVRRVKAIADRFIGLLNDDGTRNALRQQIIAMFLQMEIDGAIVPSVDGTRPAFTAAVYASPNDFATGIVRIDVALLPVHAIDYIYATLLVQN